MLPCRQYNTNEYINNCVYLLILSGTDKLPDFSVNQIKPFTAVFYRRVILILFFCPICKIFESDNTRFLPFNK